MGWEDPWVVWVYREVGLWEVERATPSLSTDEPTCWFQGRFWKPFCKIGAQEHTDQPTTRPKHESTKKRTSTSHASHASHTSHVTRHTHQRTDAAK